MDSSSADVHITASLNKRVANDLAQFCKRSTFDTFFELTDAHLSHEERTEMAHRMISGIDAISRGLAEKGFAPR